MKKTVFLTGATGTMGWQGLKELLARKENYNIRILARHSEKNIKLLAPLEKQIDIVWGDLTNYYDVLRGINGADIVLHVGGMVSPQADYKVEQTYKVNITAAENIKNAILEQKDRQPKLVYIGSVAQMGDRREPLHWGRTGDPICVSAYDHYGLTKVLAERILTDSGIKKWVSLRQSGILYPAILKNFDPIMFHVPIRGVLEWATVEDSGRLLERVCRDNIPDDFWNRYYNIGSGAEYRLTNYEFESLLLSSIGCPIPERIFNSKWFATRNFHGMWYLDSDVLDNYLHFRAYEPVREYFDKMSHSTTLPASIRFARFSHAAKLVPHTIRVVMQVLANSKLHGTQTWIKTNDKKRIAAYYGSIEKYNAIPSWENMDLSHPQGEAIVLSHGYDEDKPQAELDIKDMQGVAEFRGGKCVSKKMQKGDLDTPLEWECAEGHHFKASPRLIMLGGHWCPDCFPLPYKFLPNNRPWHWDAEARRNPFFAQIWKPLHDADEDNVYDYHIFDGWENAK